jgi:signal transduction histidine kinase
MTGHVVAEPQPAGESLETEAAPLSVERRASAPRRWPLRTAAAPLLLAVAYYVGAQIGFALQSPTVPQSILWLPNSIVLAVLLLEPPRRWPMYLLAALPAQLLVAAQAGAPLTTLSLLFITNCADAMLGAIIVRRATGGLIDFGRLPTMLAFIAFAAVLSPIVLSFADAAITVLTDWGSDYWAAFATRVRSNVLTHLVVVPTLVSAVLTSRETWRAIPARRYAEALAILMGLLLAALFAFGRLLAPDAGPLHTIPAPFILPLMLLLAVRFGPGMTALGLLLVAFVASWEALHASGAATTRWLEETISGLQLFLTAMAIPMLCLAAVIRERAEASAALRASYDEIRQLASRLLVAQEAERTRAAKLEEGRRQLAHMGRRATAGEMAAALSHELRQPLAAIRSNAQAGVRYLSSEMPHLGEVRAILEDIVADDTRASSIIDRIRGLLRNEQPRMDAVNLNDVCGRVEVLARGDALLHETRLTLHLDPELPMVLGDPIQLEQVALNLILNALEAAVASERNREVSVTTSRADGVVELAVHDTGRGIGPDVAPRLFEPFFSTKPEGLGMGLVIVRSIVERHWGSVRVDSGVHGGAVFTVTLPVKGAAPAAPRAV